jgi:hypothetical protein
MKAVTNNKNSQNETTLKNLSATQRNILLTALLRKKELHFEDNSDTGKVILKEINIMIAEIIKSMHTY